MNRVKIIIFVFLASFLGFISALAISKPGIEENSLEAIEDGVNKQIEKNLELANSQKNEDSLPLIKEVLDIIKKDYVEEKSNKELGEAAATGILQNLDPHSAYLSGEALKEMQVQTKGEFGGLGIEIANEMSLIKVISAIEDTPAFKEGIKSGDYISRIDGKSTISMPIDEAVKMLRGKAGSSVTLTILRKGEKAPIIKKITRQVVRVKAVKAMAINQVAYIKILTFSEQTHSGMVAEIKKLKSQIGENKIQGLVLDLRNNPGGLLNQAVSVSDEFLDANLDIVSIKGRDPAKDIVYRDTNPQELVANLPIVVLINEGSASASEIVAGALKDNKRAIIVGKKSFGKGSVQTVSPLQSRFGAIRLTTALYYTPSKSSIQAKGIVPDIEISEAKIQKSLEGDKSFEADLTNHLENTSIKELLEIETGKKSQEEDLSLYNSDYQLARAVDIVKSSYIYQKTIEKVKKSEPSKKTQIKAEEKVTEGNKNKEEDVEKKQSKPETNSLKNLNKNKP